MPKDKFHKDLMEMYANHQGLWYWLAKNPKKQKWNWPEWERNGGSLSAIELCFPCQ